jgi:hypothetical protein
MIKAGIRFTILWVLIVVCVSCRPENYDTADGAQSAIIRLEVKGDAQTDVSTRGVSEDAISDVHVLVYNSGGELIGQKYQTGGGSITVTTHSATNCTVYVIANTGDADLFKGYDIHSEKTLKSLKRNISSWDELSTGNYLPMTGSKSGVNIVAGSQSLGTFTVSRLVAKVTLNVGVATGSGVTITNYTVHNLPSKAYYLARPTSTENDSSDTGNTLAGDDAVSVASDWINSSTAALAGTTTVNSTFYMYENRRGMNTAIAVGDDHQKDKNVVNAPAHATYIEIRGVKNNTNVTWWVYLGANNSNNFNIKRNCRYTYNITLNATGVADLRVSIETLNVVSLSSEGNANCYLAYANNQWYSFDATVRGNGNVSDYAALQYPSNNISLFPSKIDGAATAIDIPKEKVKDAIVVWETTKGLISWVIWDKSTGQIKFKTGTDKGNALIAVRDASQNILWSWHIWRTDGISLAVMNGSHSITAITNTDRDWYKSLMSNQTDFVGGLKRTLKMMDRNLGSQGMDADGNIGASLLHYQFGRKDPFPAGNTYATTSSQQVGGDIPLYNASGSFTIKDKVVASNVIVGSTTTDILDYSIKNPERFIYSSDGSNNWVRNATLNTDAWCTSNCLWGDNNTASGIVGAGYLDPKPWDGKKTIYDPCPAGWRVAPVDAFTGICDTSIQSWIDINPSKVYLNNSWKSGYYPYGWIYCFGSTVGPSTFCFASGGRGSGEGALWVIGYYGNNWLSSPGGRASLQGCFLSFSSNIVYVVGENNRASGFTVRCVQEI